MMFLICLYFLNLVLFRLRDIGIVELVNKIRLRVFYVSQARRIASDEDLILEYSLIILKKIITGFRISRISALKIYE